MLRLIFFILFFAAPVFASTSGDAELLNKIQKDSIAYFLNHSEKSTGLTFDSSKAGAPASVSATGFSLAAIAIGDDRGWIKSKTARKHLRKTLQTLLRRTDHHKGFFYHFVDSKTGRRVWSSEASSMDTALVVAGALLVAQHYPGTDLERMAWKIYKRVDWQWMMNGSPLICMGWTPESGFLPYYWDSYNELILLQALAIGSPTHPISKQAWNEWLRPEERYQGNNIVFSHSGSLFTYQFAQAFIDFRNLNDRGINYFENSKQAALANRAYSLSFQNQFKSYSKKSWGLSASLGPGGYKAYGAKPGAGLHDGTIAPYAAIASLPFTPKESLAAIRFFHDELGKKLYGDYGFKDAFNLDKKWWAEEYLGIDQGISVLMLENYNNQNSVWKKFMSLEPIQKWIRLCELGSKT